MHFEEIFDSVKCPPSLVWPEAIPYVKEMTLDRLKGTIALVKREFGELERRVYASGNLEAGGALDSIDEVSMTRHSRSIYIYIYIYIYIIYNLYH